MLLNGQTILIRTVGDRLFLKSPDGGQLTVFESVKETESLRIAAFGQGDGTGIENGNTTFKRFQHRQMSVSVTEDRSGGNRRRITGVPQVSVGQEEAAVLCNNF